MLKSQIIWIFYSTKNFKNSSISHEKDKKKKNRLNAISKFAFNKKQKKQTSAKSCFVTSHATTNFFLGGIIFKLIDYFISRVFIEPKNN